MTEVLKRSVNHKSWLTGFRSFVRIPSTIPTGTSRLDIWILGYLDYGIQFVAASPIRTSVWCSPAGGFFSGKNRSLGFCNLKHCFLHSTKTIFNGTRLDRRGLKNECVRFQYGTKLMARKFVQNLKLNMAPSTISPKAPSTIKHG